MQNDWAIKIFQCIGVALSFLLLLFFPWMGLVCAVGDSTIIGMSGSKKRGISFSRIALAISTVLLSSSSSVIKYEILESSESCSESMNCKVSGLSEWLQINTIARRDSPYYLGEGLTQTRELNTEITRTNSLANPRNGKRIADSTDNCPSTSVCAGLLERI